ncbi:NAD(P)/FAD-dependent oxidoreductase [Kordiimonas aestuarii]|uniref:NAD(P)/FAD-dependent oxidoreductase n=1 Tax=Kordiimonas aestuarii TaxID=1005925 RepID=UPI0021D300C9|nr:FAD-binding oxidoreductase [Kordiimonas aestuarii]
MIECDFLIIGAGIAGAGAAYRLAPHGPTVMLDMEEQAGYHTTGRSAAFYAETYGGPKVQPLTTASKAFFRTPPAGFTDVPLLKTLGALHIYRADQRHAADRLFTELSATLPGVKRLNAAEVKARAPHVDTDALAGAIDDPDCGDLDVAALHQGYLRAAKAMGATLMLDALFETAAHDGTSWHVKTRKGPIRAKVVINSAGAWGDEVARRAGVEPLGLMPLRRTIVTLPRPADLPFDRHGPVVLDIEEEFYFKPEGDGYLVTPADESVSVACDAQPELEDVARAVNCFEQAVGRKVEKIDAKWAGLRTFGPDRTPVIGFASDAPAFFWNVGQGGYGIQTSPAWSDLLATLVLGRKVPAYLEGAGVDQATYSPARLVTEPA